MLKYKRISHGFYFQIRRDYLSVEYHVKTVSYCLNENHVIKIIEYSNINEFQCENFGLGYPRIQNFNQGRLVYRCTCRRNSCLGKYLICSNTASVPWTPHYHWLWIIRLLSFVKSNCSLDRYILSYVVTGTIYPLESFERICFGFLSQIQKSRLPANKCSNLKITVTPTFRLYPSENIIIQLSTVYPSN